MSVATVTPAARVLADFRARTAASTQPDPTATSEPAPEKTGSGFKLDPTMVSVVDAAWGAGYGYLMGRVMGTMVGGPRMGAIGAVAGAAWSAQGAWRKGDEHAAKLEQSPSFKNANEEPLVPSMLKGALGGAAVLGGILGGVTALRMGAGSYFMGHSAATVAQNAARAGGPWLAAGAVAGGVLGAASGALMKDQSTIWGSMKDSFLNGQKAKKTFMWSGVFGGLMGALAFKNTHSVGAAAKAFGVTTAAIGSMFYLGTAFRDTMQTGTVTAVAAPHRWESLDNKLLAS